MGKGDKKTKRGKLFQGSYGVTRPKSKRKAAIAPAQPKPAAKTEEAPKPAEPKKAKAAAPAKKEAKPKKAEETE